MNSMDSRLTSTPLTILLVEDLQDDVFFFKLAMRRAGLRANVHVAEDGTEAVDYLTNKGKFGDPALYPKPDLVFLDLKMPNMNGFEVMEWLVQNPQRAPLKIIVLTGSEEPADRAKAQALGALGYLIKPPPPDRLAGFFADAQSAQMDSTTPM